MYFTDIDDYSITYPSRGLHPRIGLRVHGRYIAQLLFMPDGHALPDDGLIGEEYRLHYHLHDFANVIELLRSGQAVQLVFCGSGSPNENGLRLYNDVLP